MSEPTKTKANGWTWRKEKEDEFKKQYQDVLFGQYAGLSMDAHAIKKDAEDVIAKGKKAEWEDLYRLELDIVKLEPLVSLRRRAWVLRQEYQEVASVDEVKGYYASNPPDPDAGPEDQLRADCCRLQEELNWRYIVISILEDFRGSLTRRIVWFVLGVLIAIFILPLIIDWVMQLFPGVAPINYAFLAMIVVPGVLGGLVSTLRRIQATEFGGNADLVLAQFENGSASVYVSPLFGGIFAFLFFCLVAGGMVTGNLFPKIGFENLLRDTVASPDFTEYSKLIIWSFIAGFSERFVPDQLDALSREASTKVSGATSGNRTNTVVVEPGDTDSGKVE